MNIRMNGSIEDLLEAARTRLERVNDQIDNYNDPSWVQARVVKLIDKREAAELEIKILQSAAQQLKEMEGKANG